MTTHHHYIFTSERLGFRNWRDEDIPALAEINADPEVMKHFPAVLSLKETEALMQRLQALYDKRGYNYFATEVLDTGELIGFIGLAYQVYDADFNPSTDIGWRLKKSAWGKGYATEGAKRCLAYAFDDLHLDRVISTCTQNNVRSENVMKKIGMTRMGEFDHTELTKYPAYQRCVWYEIKNNG